MKALIEVKGPSHRIVTAAALVAVLVPGETDHDLTIPTAVREFRNFAEWFADMIDEAGEYWLEAGELTNALVGCRTLADRLERTLAIVKQRDAEAACNP